MKKNNTWISKLKAVKISLSVHQSCCKILMPCGMSKLQRNFIVTLLLIDFVMIPLQIVLTRKAYF